MRRLHCIRASMHVDCLLPERAPNAAREKAEKYSGKLWEKLREYYVNAKRLAEAEER